VDQNFLKESNIVHPVACTFEIGWTLPAQILVIVDFGGILSEDYLDKFIVSLVYQEESILVSDLNELKLADYLRVHNAKSSIESLIKNCVVYNSIERISHFP
jgi:hypothetical protein